MIRVIDVYGFEWTFTTTEEAIEFIEGFKDQENFEIRGQTARSIFLAHWTNIRSSAPGRTLPRAGPDFVN